MGIHWPDEPDDHALGQSRGCLTTKIHLACAGKGRPLAILLAPGQRHDSICARPLLERIRVPRTGLGWARCPPDNGRALGRCPATIGPWPRILDAGGTWILMVQESGVCVGMKHYSPEFKADAVALYRLRPGRDDQVGRRWPQGQWDPGRRGPALGLS
ncbi:hypothetical protein [Streptomyces sp. NPDC055085]